MWTQTRLKGSSTKFLFTRGDVFSGHFN